MQADVLESDDDWKSTHAALVMPELLEARVFEPSGFAYLYVQEPSK